VADCDDRYLEALLTFDLLEGEERAALDSHLGACAACRERLSWIRRAEDHVRRLVAGVHGAHPSPAALYDFAGGPAAEALDEESRRATAAHVDRCEECAREIRRAREVDASDPVLEGLLEEDEAQETFLLPEREGTSLTELLRTAPQGEAPPEPARPTFTVTPSAETRTAAPWRRALLPLAAAAAVVLSIVLVPKDPVPPPDAWIVLSPAPSARMGVGAGSRPLRAGDRIPAGLPVENTGPETLVLARVAGDAAPDATAVLLGAGEALAHGETPRRTAKIPNLTALLRQPLALPVLRGDAQQSRLLYPRLTIRSRRPTFTFLPLPEGGTYRAVVFSKEYLTGKTTQKVVTKPGSGPYIAFEPEDESLRSLPYDDAVYYEWRLEREENGIFRTIDSADFYLHSSPATVEEVVAASRQALATEPRAAHYFVAQVFLRDRLFLAALRELIDSDPDLQDPGVRDLAQRISRNLRVDLEASRPLLKFLDLR